MKTTNFQISRKGNEKLLLILIIYVIVITHFTVITCFNVARGRVNKGWVYIMYEPKVSVLCRRDLYWLPKCYIETHNATVKCVISDLLMIWWTCRSCFISRGEQNVLKCAISNLMFNHVMHYQHSDWPKVT